MRRALEIIGVTIGEGQGLRNLPPKDSVRYQSSIDSNEDLNYTDYNRMTTAVYNKRGWAYSLLDSEDLSLLKSKQYEIYKGNRYPKTADGLYVVEINNKILFVSGKYSDPVIEIVLAANVDSAADFEMAKQGRTLQMREKTQEERLSVSEAMGKALDIGLSRDTMLKIMRALFQGVHGLNPGEPLYRMECTISGILEKSASATECITALRKAFPEKMKGLSDKDLLNT